MAKGTLTERVDKLEDAMVKLAHALAETQEEMKDFKNVAQQWMKKIDEEIKAHREDTNKKIEEYKAETDKKIEEIRKETDRKIEEYKAETDKKIEEIRKETDRKIEEYKAETDRKIEEIRKETDRKIEEYKAETDKKIEEIREETRKDIKEMKRMWGDLARKMGTITEDIVAPNIPRVAREYFGCSEMEDFHIRAERKSRKADKVKEFDVIAACEDKVILVEVKSKVAQKDVEEFIGFVESGEFYDYYPEKEGKELVPIFASFSVGEAMVRRLTKSGIYVMVMGEETMEIVNYDEVRKRKK